MTRNKQNIKNPKNLTVKKMSTVLLLKKTENNCMKLNDLIKTLVQEVKTLKEDLKVSNLKVKNL